MESICSAPSGVVFINTARASSPLQASTGLTTNFACFIRKANSSSDFSAVAELLSPLNTECRFVSRIPRYPARSFPSFMFMK